MVRKLVKYNGPNSLLVTRPCSDWTNFTPKGQIELKKLVFDMAETCRFYQGVGLSANQVGVYKKVAIIMEPNKKPITIINPVILEQEGELVEDNEGCLSAPGEVGKVDRSRYVTVEYQEITGRKRTVVAQNFEARIILHEIGHLNNQICTQLYKGK